MLADRSHNITIRRLRIGRLIVCDCPQYMQSHLLLACAIRSFTDRDLDTDAWLNTWVNNNVGPIAANQFGFTGAFATWAIGNPDFSCRDDGSSSDCDFNPCNNVVLNSKGVDVRPTYYIMESLVGIHTYFTGLREAFTVSAIGAALSKDGWARTFYNDKDDKSVVALREIFNVMAMTVGIIACLTGIGGLVGMSAPGSGSSIQRIPCEFRKSS